MDKVSNRTIAGGLFLLSASLFAVTESTRYGDAPDYASEIRRGALIEPGHMLWRPIGRVIALAAGQLNSTSNTLWTLQFLGMAASALAVACLFLLTTRLYARPIALFLSLVFAVSNGFWVYAFSGCSYGMSVLFQIAALYFATIDLPACNRVRIAAAAGACGGLAAATWGAQIIVAPAMWLVLMLKASLRSAEIAERLKITLALGSGYVLSFVVPICIFYALRGSLDARAYVAPSPGGKGVLAWLASASHDIPPHSGLAQALRVAIGWPQSITSVGGLGADLRLWLYGDSGFPWSSWIIVVLVFYLLMMLLALLLFRIFRSSNVSSNGLLIGSIVAVGINLSFGALWQGTDLERYLPSLPFQVLLLGAALSATRMRAAPAAYAAAIAVPLIIGLLNWFGSFEPALGRSSYRQEWLDALRAHARADDVVVLLGPRKFSLVAPHDPNFPRIVNISYLVSTAGDAWRDAVQIDLAKVAKEGGRVLLGDSLFSRSSSPRDGWSFAEHPRPSPDEIADYFLPWRGADVAFEVNGERLWVGSR